MHTVRILCSLIGLVGIILATVLGHPYDQPSINPTSKEDVTEPGPCPGNLVPDEFEYPHVAIPISSVNTDQTYPNTYGPYVTAGDFEMIFNFDIPDSRKGQKCVFQFFLPNHTQLTTSSFELDGDYGGYLFSLSVLGAGAVEGNTTFNNQPLAGNPHGFPRIIYVEPGRAWDLGTTICVPGRIAVTMSSGNSSLKWFQDYNPCPIGLYISYQP